MPKINLSLDPVDLITVDAIGKPGSRVFYIQGRQGSQVVSLIIEKLQLQSLIAGVRISQRSDHQVPGTDFPRYRS